MRPGFAGEERTFFFILNESNSPTYDYWYYFRPGFAVVGKKFCKCDGENFSYVIKLNNSYWIKTNIIIWEIDSNKWFKYTYILFLVYVFG